MYKLVLLTMATLWSLNTFGFNFLSGDYCKELQEQYNLPIKLCEIGRDHGASRKEAIACAQMTRVSKRFCLRRAGYYNVSASKIYHCGNTHWTFYGFRKCLRDHSDHPLPRFRNN